MTSDELAHGKTYRAKRFVGRNDGPNNDRTIIHLGVFTVQYDSDTVRNNSRYPSVSREKFAKWAKREVSAQELRQYYGKPQSADIMMSEVQ